MFVTFEGLDGSGKSTQADLLAARLRGDGVDVVSTREPGGTELGEGVRELVLHGGHVGPWAEALLYVAARAQLVDEVIRQHGGDIMDRAGDGVFAAFDQAVQGSDWATFTTRSRSATSRMRPSTTVLPRHHPVPCLHGRARGTPRRARARRRAESRPT